MGAVRNALDYFALIYFVNRVLIILSVHVLTSCDETHYLTKTWSSEKTFTADSIRVYDETNAHTWMPIQDSPVKVRGLLRYYFDESAVFPFYEQSSFKPVWINVGAEDTSLHLFLLENNESSVIVTGIYDTKGFFDKYSYNFQIKEVMRVTATKYSRTQRSDISHNNTSTEN